MSFLHRPISHPNQGKQTTLGLMSVEPGQGQEAEVLSCRGIAHVVW